MTIKLARYNVWNWTRPGSGNLIEYTVARTDKESPVATFKVSDTHPAEEQQARAHEYRDYMNKIIDATEEAYSQTQLADILKG